MYEMRATGAVYVCMSVVSGRLLLESSSGRSEETEDEITRRVCVCKEYVSVCIYLGARVCGIIIEMEEDEL